MKELTPEQIVAYVTDLAQRENNAVGFVPNTIYGKALERDNLHLVYENGEACGFVFHGPPLPTVRIYQTAVEATCRLADHGREAWLATMIEALDCNAEEIRWICAEDLPANQFWERVACPPLVDLIQRTPTRRRLYQYKYLLPRGRQLEAYLDEQFRGSSAWKIAKLQGIEAWLEHQWKKRYRRSPK